MGRLIACFELMTMAKEGTGQAGTEVVWIGVLCRMMGPVYMDDLHLNRFEDGLSAFLDFEHSYASDISFWCVTDSPDLESHAEYFLRILMVLLF